MNVKGFGAEIISGGKSTDAESDDWVDLRTVYSADTGAADAESVHLMTPPGPSLFIPENTSSGFPGEIWRKPSIAMNGQGDTSSGGAPVVSSTV